MLGSDAPRFPLDTHSSCARQSERVGLLIDGSGEIPHWFAELAGRRADSQKKAGIYSTRTYFVRVSLAGADEGTTLGPMRCLNLKTYFFSGKDVEQMRLTEEGNLGVGTDKPKAKLDVAGVIRTRNRD